MKSFIIFLLLVCLGIPGRSSCLHSASDAHRSFPYLKKSGASAVAGTSHCLLKGTFTTYDVDRILSIEDEEEDEYRNVQHRPAPKAGSALVFSRVQQHPYRDPPADPAGLRQRPGGNSPLYLIQGSLRI